MRRKTNFTTLDEQRRRQMSTLEGGKKLLGGCFVGAAIFLFAASGGSEAISSLAIGCALLGAGVLIRLKQLSLRPFVRQAVSLILIIIGLYFTARAAAAMLVNFIASGGVLI